MKARVIQSDIRKPRRSKIPTEAMSPLALRPSPGIGGRAREPAAAPIAGELALVWGGLGALAVHILDDNFIQPEPGTSAAEHWASGLVPFLVIVAGGFLLPRVRAGPRAATAMVFGVLALVAGAEAAYYLTRRGMSGDDYTGLLSIFAGVLLLAVGTSVLWRSRRTQDSRVWRYLRRLLLAGLAVVVVSVLLFPVGVAYVVTHVARADVPDAALGAEHEDVEFTTSDGLRLEGWFVPSRNGATVIAFPGRSGPQNQARMLIRHGYGVLLFDRRGESASEGDPNMFGWAGDRDLHAAVQPRCSISGAGPTSTRRRPRPYRRHWALGRRRDADPSSCGFGGAQGGGR